jgi:hypothetical protein
MSPHTEKFAAARISAHLNELDVTESVRVSDPEAVKFEVVSLFATSYPGVDTSTLEAAFTLFAQIYQGQFPGYQACDTIYHDIQHSLDITLTATRLLRGYHKVHGDLGARDMLLGIITALFHDVGYIRRNDDREKQNGAEYTSIHVSRGAKFIQTYLPLIGLTDIAGPASLIVHLTGYEKNPDDIQTRHPLHRLVGDIVATSDLITQMADRCYLEKCRDRLFPELVLAAEGDKTNTKMPTYESPAALLYNTPSFYRLYVKKRLDHNFKGVYQYASAYFNGINHYIEKLEGNIRHLEKLVGKQDLSGLQRSLPGNYGVSVFPFERVKEIASNRRNNTLRLVNR